MSTTLFIDQERLELLIANGKAQLEGATLLFGLPASRYILTPVVKIIRCETSGDDPLGIANKIIALDTLERAGADIYINSITIRRHSYRIDQGYLCRRSS